jgi:hypothetical protein
MTDTDRHTHIPPFALNTSAYGRCKRCKEIDILNRDGTCDDCRHKQQMQNVINGIVALGKGSTPEQRQMILDAIYESALPLVRE